MNTIKIDVKRNCNHCSHKLVCAYRKSTEDFAKGMQGMFGQYTNNLVSVFDSNASRCVHYTAADVDTLMKKVIGNEQFKEIKGVRVKFTNVTHVGFDDGTEYEKSELYKHVELDIY